MIRLFRFLLLAMLPAVIPMSARAAWINDPAPPFELPALAGEKISLAQYKGQVVIVNFWASWCPPCKEEFPRLNELASAGKNKNVHVIAISLDKAQANIHKFLAANAQQPVALTILRDPDGKTAAAYKARAMPMSFVVDKKGLIRFAHMGFQKGDDAKWRDEVNQLIGE